MNLLLKYTGLIASTVVLSFGSLLLPVNLGLETVAVKGETVEEREAEAERLGELGIQQYQQGQFRNALITFEQLLVIFRELGDREDEGTTLNNIGAVYRSIGKYQQALDYYQQALLIFKEVGDRSGEGTTLNNLGLVYESIGKYQQALDYYEQALVIIKEVGDRSGEGTTLNNLGLVYHSIGKYQQALDYYEQALVIRKEVGDRSGEGTTLNNLGGVYDSIGKYQQALDYFQQALVIIKEVGDRSGEGTTLNNLGGVYQRIGKYQQALDYYQQALVIIKEVGDRSGEGTTLNNLGRVYLTQNQHVEAETILFKALAVLESLRTQDLSDSDKISFAETYENIYRALQEALIAENKIHLALETSERSRTRALADLLANRFNQEQPQPPSIKKIQQIAADQKATLVEYSLIREEELYIYLIKPTGEIHFHSVDLKSLNKPIQEIIKKARLQVINARGSSSEANNSEESTSWEKSLQQLHQVLIQPIAHLLPTDPEEKIIFIPHRSLFLVPFPALSDSNDKYLIEKHTILTAPSIDTLSFTKKHQQRVQNQPAEGPILIVGDPDLPTQGEEELKLSKLPGAKREAKAIVEMLQQQGKSNITLMLDQQATETAIIPKMANASIIHFAAHGLLNETKAIGLDPGAIVFAPSDEDDGFLTTTEIMELHGLEGTKPLQAELVVISACDTNRGDIKGEGVIGLSRALTASGVPSLVVSLWKVDDYATTEFMKLFYRNIYIEKQDKAKALRQAMLMMLSEEYPDPKHWAAFTLIGQS